MFTGYEPRPRRFLGMELRAGFRIKLYSIALRGVEFDRARFERAWELAERALPLPAVEAAEPAPLAAPRGEDGSVVGWPGLPGVGFAIMHQGATGDYFVLSWWANENELPTRVFVRAGDGWRPARDGESFCVWDLEIMWHEREAYVRAMLTRGGAGIEGYLRDAIG